MTQYHFPFPRRIFFVCVHGPVGRLDAQSGRCRLEAVVSFAERVD